MKCLAIALLAIVLSAESNAAHDYNQEKGEETIQQVHIVFAHGDRTPEGAIGFKNNPHVNETFFPYGRGELTLKGRRSAFNLGSLLKAKYGKFLGNFYHNNLLTAYSSEVRRCQMSLLTVLAAMFPPTNAWKVADGINWQPIPYTVPCPDKLIATYISCGKIFNIKTENIDEQTRFIYDYLSEKTETPVKNSYDVFAIQNTMQVQLEVGYGLPTWAYPIWNNMFKNASMQFWKDVSNQYLGELIGNLLNKIVQDTKSKIAGTISQKLFLYAGHDFNYVSFLTALNAYDGTQPRYSSYISVELHKKGDIYGYQIYKFNYDTDKPCLLEIPDCGTFCPVDEFYEKIVSKIYQGDKWCSAGQ